VSRKGKYQFRAKIIKKIHLTKERQREAETKIGVGQKPKLPPNSGEANKHKGAVN